MKQLVSIRYSIHNILEQLNAISKFQNLMDNNLYVEFSNNDSTLDADNKTKIKERISFNFKHHIDRLNYSLKLTEMLINDKVIENQFNYINIKSLLDFTPSFVELLSSNIRHLTRDSHRINNYNEKLISSITLFNRVIQIRYSSDDIDNLKIKYELSNIFLRNEAYIDLLKNLTTDLYNITDIYNIRTILPELGSLSNNNAIWILNEFINKQTEINELTNILFKNKNFISEIDSHKIDFENIISQYTDIEDDLLKKTNVLEAAINKSNTAFSSFNAKVEFINGNFNLIKNNEEKITTAMESIDEINKIGSDSKKINNFMEQKKTDIEQILNDAKDTIKILSGSSIAKHLNTQEKKEAAAAKWWLISSISILISSVLLVVVSFLIYGLSWEGITLKVLTLPILLSSLIFTMRQYIKRKNIVDSYAYKKILALSLTGFKKQIDKSINDEKQIDYVLKAIEILTEPPLNDLEKDHVKNELDTLNKIRESVIDNILSTIHPPMSSNKDTK
ncbi:hypothetical protein VP018_002798 [Morganella morganii]|nr:hypothetical protein [Morganella morganii]